MRWCRLQRRQVVCCCARRAECSCDSVSPSQPPSTLTDPVVVATTISSCRMRRLRGLVCRRGGAQCFSQQLCTVTCFLLDIVCGRVYRLCLCFCVVCVTGVSRTDRATTGPVPFVSHKQLSLPRSFSPRQATWRLSPLSVGPSVCRPGAPHHRQVSPLDNWRPFVALLPCYIPH